MPTACSRPQPPTRGESPVVPGADSTRRQQAHTAPTRPWPCNTTGLPSTRDPRAPHRTIPICQIDPYERRKPSSSEERTHTDQRFPFALGSRCVTAVKWPDRRPGRAGSHGRKRVDMIRDVAAHTPVVRGLPVLGSALRMAKDSRAVRSGTGQCHDRRSRCELWQPVFAASSISRSRSFRSSGRQPPLAEPQPGLAAPPGPGQRDQARGLHQRTDRPGSWGSRRLRSRAGSATSGCSSSRSR